MTRNRNLDRTTRTTAGKRLATAAIAVLGALALAAAAVAGGGNDGWKPASGTGTSSFTVQSITHRGQDTILRLTGLATVAGTLSGPVSLDSAVWVIHPDGSSRLVGTGIATAAIGDCGAVPGGVRYESTLFAQAQPDGSLSFSGPARTVGRHTAEYRITLTGTNPPGATSGTFTYSGKYRCAGHDRGRNGDDD